MDNQMIGLWPAIGMEAFVTIHMSLFVLLPLAGIISERNRKKVFWALFGARVIFLLVFDFFITTAVAFLDFASVFLGIVLVAALGGLKRALAASAGSAQTASGQTAVNAAPQTNAAPAADKRRVTPADFDPLFSKNTDECLQGFIERELQRAGINNTKGLIPEEVLRRRNILNILFAVLLYLYISLIFFHFPVFVYAFGLIILVVYAVLTSRYKLMKYLMKEVKARPQEKISNIILNVRTTLVPDYSVKLLVALSVVAVGAALVTFAEPRIFYEKADGGVNVRYYAFGLTNMTSVEIPDTYKGEKVVGLRGNTFSNMPFLKEVTLPNTIGEIRGQAFKNCVRLERVKLPEHLEYLGGGAFYQCERLESIVLPDTLTYLGGEAFYGCESLRSVQLSDNLSEIRGNTFENCIRLKSIDIPDRVNRIGGHAFYGDRNLNSVGISPDSSLREIGSSAFRLCTGLKEITLPADVTIDERAFKETNVRIAYYE